MTDQYRKHGLMADKDFRAPKGHVRIICENVAMNAGSADVIADVVWDGGPLMNIERILRALNNEVAIDPEDERFFSAFDTEGKMMNIS